MDEMLFLSGRMPLMPRQNADITLPRPPVGRESKRGETVSRDSANLEPSVDGKQGLMESARFLQITSASPSNDSSKGMRHDCLHTQFHI